MVGRLWFGLAATLALATTAGISRPSEAGTQCDAPLTVAEAIKREGLDQPLELQQRREADVVNAFRRALKSAPSDIFLNQLYMDYQWVTWQMLDPSWRSQLRSLRQRDPRSEGLSYLEMRADLMSGSSPSLADLEAAKRNNPDSPLPHLLLGYYYSEIVQNDQHLAVEATATIALCPSTPRAYAALARVRDCSWIADHLGAFRRVVENQQLLARALYSPLLWSVELRCADDSGRADAVARIKRDVALMDSGRNSEYTILQAIAAGHQLIGDEANVTVEKKQIIRKFPNSDIAVGLRLSNWLAAKESVNGAPGRLGSLEALAVVDRRLSTSAAGRRVIAIAHEYLEAQDERELRLQELRQVWKSSGGSASGMRAYTAALVHERQTRQTVWRRVAESLAERVPGDIAREMGRYAQGRAIVVVWWAAWCAPCISELPEVQRFAEESARRTDVVVMTVNVDEVVERAQEVMRRGMFTVPTIFVGKKSGLVSEVPETWIVDRSGCVLLTKRGGVKGSWKEDVLNALRSTEAILATGDSCGRKGEIP